MKQHLTLSLLAGAGLLVHSSNANTVTFDTPPGATTGGGAVNASATFTTEANGLTITMMNLQANPTDVAQLISDLSFGLTSGQTSGSLTSSSGQELTVAQNGGTYTLGPTVDTGWAVLSGLHLSVLGTPIGPAHLIIGPADANNLYSSANGSIAGNNAHNAFLADSATFTISIPGLTSSDSVNSATFSFGTTDGIEIVGIPRSNISVSDGSTTVGLLGVALPGLGLLRRKLHS